MSIPKKKIKNKRFPLIAALIIGIIMSCIAGFIIALASKDGAFTSWDSLSGPPSGAIHIIYTDPENLWVEAANDNIYSLTFLCNDNEDCSQWVLAEKSDIPLNQNPLARNKDCSNFWGYPLLNDPFFGEVVECINAPVFHPEVKIDEFYALMSDGTVRYSVRGGLDFVLHFIVSTSVLFILTAIILIREYRDKLFLKREKAG